MAVVVSEQPTEERGPGAIGWRGLVEGLLPPRHIADQLPASLQEDEFCLRMVAALDEVIAPIYWALDCWDAYLEPQLAPEDFLEWLAAWVGVDVDETWDIDRRRQLIQDAAVLYRVRGTATGLAAHIQLYSGITPVIEESGGCAWSQTAGSPMPGSTRPHLTVRLQVEDASAVKQSTVSRITAASRPAHLPYGIEIMVGGTAMAAPVEEAGQEEAAKDAPGAVALPGSERIDLAPPAPPSEQEIDETPEAGTDAGPPAE